MKITSSQFYEFWTSQHEMNIKKNNAERLYENITDVIDRYNDYINLNCSFNSERLIKTLRGLFSSKYCAVIRFFRAFSIRNSLPFLSPVTKSSMAEESQMVRQNKALKGNLFNSLILLMRFAYMQNFLRFPYTYASRQLFA